MLALQDGRWAELRGAYRVAYDPRPALARLASGTDVRSAWSELWNELHHQGNVDTASYAAVPHLVRIHRERRQPDTHAMLGVIEIERARSDNPPVPAWLSDGYDDAWREIVAVALHDLAVSDERLLTQGALGVLALARGLRGVGEVLLGFGDEEIREMVAMYRGESSG